MMLKKIRRRVEDRLRHLTGAGPARARYSPSSARKPSGPIAASARARAR